MVDPTIQKSQTYSTQSNWEWREALCQLRLRALGVAMLIMGIPDRHLPAIEDNVAGGFVCFQAIALVLSSITFSATAYMYSSELLGNPWYTSLILGSLALLVLFILDRQTFIALRLSPDTGRGKAWFVRGATIFMTIMMALVSGSKAFRPEIDTLLKEKAGFTEKTLRDSPSSKQKLDDLNATVKRHENHIREHDELSALINSIPDLERRKKDQCDGNVDANTGVKAVTGCGEIAKGLQTDIDSREKQIEGKRAYLSNARAEDRAMIQISLDSARNEIKMHDEKLTTDARQRAEGATERVGAFFLLLGTRWAAWPPVLFWFAMALLPEIMLLLAMAGSSALRSAYDVLNELERERTQAIALQMARAMKAEIAARAPELVRVRPLSAASMTGRTPSGATTVQPGWRDAAST